MICPCYEPEKLRINLFPEMQKEWIGGNKEFFLNVFSLLYLRDTQGMSSRQLDT